MPKRRRTAETAQRANATPAMSPPAPDWWKTVRPWQRRCAVCCASSRPQRQILRAGRCQRDHVQIAARIGFNARVLAQRGLIQLKLCPLDVEVPRERLRPLQFDEKPTRLVLRIEQRQCAQYQQEGEQDTEAAAHCAALVGVSRAATRMTAERARGLTDISAADGFIFDSSFISGCGKSAARIGKRRSGCGTLALDARNCLTMRSSNE